MIASEEITQLYELALAEHRAGRLDEARAQYERILSIDSAHADAIHLLGVIAHQCGDEAKALHYIANAIVIHAKAPYYCNYGNVLQAIGRTEEAERAFRRATAIQPALAVAHHNLGLLLHSQGRDEEAIGSFESAVRLAPETTDFHLSLAGACVRHRLYDRAVQSLRHAVALEPDRADLRCNLGAALNDAGAVLEAIEQLRHAIALDELLANAHYNLGIALLGRGELRESLASFRRAAELAPDHAESHVNAGSVLWRLGALEEARAACERGLEIRESLPEGHVTLGNVLKDAGLVAEGIAHYRRALQLRPEDAAAHANLIFSLHYLSTTTAAEVGAEIASWNERQTKGIHPSRPRWTSSRERIAIGYVSANLRTHPGGFFLGAVIGAHDRSAFEVTCYVDSVESDEHSRRIAAGADHWRVIAGLPDDELAARVREDGIDILVDMNRFAGSCRLRAFAYKPAPVQVTWMGGPVTTTGMEAMDYVLTDAVHTPPEAEGSFAEKVIRLDNAYGVYEAPHYAPPVGLLPASRNGAITFGSFNNLAKLQPEVLRLWASILFAVPDSRLLLQSKAFAYASVRERIHDQFARHGIAPGRVPLQGGVSHRDLLALYGQVDIALDPFPYSGGITTCEALWMGVPVVTMPGPVIPVRHSVSHLRSAGLPGWIASGPDEYVRCAVALAKDRSRLALIRAGLRDRIASSKLGDVAGFTRRLEDVYREMRRRAVAAEGAGS